MGDDDDKKVYTAEEMRERLLKESEALNINTKKEIELPKRGRLISTFAEELGNFFGQRKEIFYRPAEECVVNIEMQSVNEKGNKNTKEVLGFKEIKSTKFITFIEKYFDIGETIYPKNSLPIFIVKSLSQADAEKTLVSEQFTSKLNKIQDVFNVPRPFLINKELKFPKKGYDKDLWSWVPLDAPEIQPDMKLEEAKKILDEIYKDFCFKTEQDRVNAITALLTPFCRGLYNRETCRTPIFFYRANREGAGKDYCAGITGVVYEGEAVEDSPIVSDGEVHDDELRKKILSVFKIGRIRIHSSNNKGYLNSSELEQIATAEVYEARQLGSNTMLKFPNKLELSVSANTGISYTPDLARRSIFINLFYAEENINERKFSNPDLHGWLKENRGRVLSALYSLVRNWYNNGMKQGTVLFSSYPDWARVVGGIMEAAGYNSPCVPNDPDGAGDTNTKEMKLFFELSHNKWQNQWVAKTDIISELSNPNGEFSELFNWLDWTKDLKSSKMKFGRHLAKYVDRELSGIKLEARINEKHPDQNQYRFFEPEQDVDLIVNS